LLKLKKQQTMFETLPQHAQHPQYFQQLQQQQHLQSGLLSCRNNIIAAHAPMRPSPLGPRDANTHPILASSRSSFQSSTSTMMMPPKGWMTSDDSASAAKTDKTTSAFSSPLFSSDKENAFALQHQQQQQQQQQQTRFSPLFSFSSSETAPTAPQKRISSYEQRYKSGLSSNPLNKIFGESGSSSRPTVRAATTAAKHRELFLNKVKRDRDAGRFNARGEQMMRMECLSEQRKWGETMRRDAEGLFRQYHDHLEEEVEEKEEDMDPDQYILDEFLSQEQQEVNEALLQNVIPGFEHQDLPQQQHPSDNSAIMSSPTHRSDRSSFYGSDDDINYDDIFGDLQDDDHIWRSQSQNMDMDMSG
jgi:hypothetical protein